MSDGPGLLIAGAVLTAMIGSLFAAGDAAVSALPDGRLAAVSTIPPPSPDSQVSPFLRYGRDRDRILSRWLVGRVIAMAITTVLLDQAGEELAIGRFRPVLAVLGAVIFYATFTEILNTMARAAPEVFGSFALRWLRPLEWLVMPLAEPLALIGRFFGQFAPERPTDARFTETEIASVVDEGQKSGTLDREPAELIKNVLEFKDLTARDVMIPRTRVSGVEISMPFDQVRKHVATDGHSRYPVYRESLDQLVGLLYAKDLFRNDGAKSVAELMRDQLLYVTESQLVASMLREMRAKHLHMAIVTDEFGGTSGIVTLEDVLEEIVGDIRDEHDAEAPVQHLGGGRVVADASISLADLAVHLNREIPSDGDYESLGGLLVHRIGHVPAVGDTLQVDNLKLIVREADQTRVVKVEIVPAKISSP